MNEIYAPGREGAAASGRNIMAVSAQLTVHASSGCWAHQDSFFYYALLTVIFYKFFMNTKLFFVVFQDRVSLCNSSRCPGTRSVDQADFGFTEIRRPAS